MKRYVLIIVVVIIGVAFMGYMLGSIGTKKDEKALLNTAPVIKEKGIEARSDVWGESYPNQYDTWKMTSQSARSRICLKSILSL